MSMIERKTIGLEEGWDFIQKKGITKLKNILEGLPEPQFTYEDYMILYTTVYNMCYQRPPPNYAQQLYDKYKEAIEDYIISIVLPSLQDKKDELLLTELLTRWSNHKTMTRCLSRFFCHLDRHHPGRKHPSLAQTSFLSFYYLVYKEINEPVMDAILALIARKHAGEQIDQTLLNNALDFYLKIEETTRENNAKIAQKRAGEQIDQTLLSNALNFYLEIEETIAKEEKMHGKKFNLISSDGDVLEVDYGVALMSKTLKDTIETIPAGDADSISVSLVSSKILTKVIEYCKKHNSTQIDVDLRDWDVQFVDVDLKTLFGLVKAANYMRIDSLRVLATSKVDDLINGKTPE